MKQVIKTFKALSDQNRLRILMMLSQKPLCVCEIQEILDITVSTVSKHLSILREAGFILSEKDGKWVYYKLNNYEDDSRLSQMMEMLPSWINNDELIRNDTEHVLKSSHPGICGAF